ncbi:unnamed protein product [Soboliphyme baturini]|uniref:CRAL-TRIO domain-containing protein n=1 Tax=Soboliphyme baturini TaxID=241478 RepID=A0A183IM12_9BILA|nr:unnamed protein product [Soboliphyme baturini]
MFSVSHQGSVMFNLNSLAVEDSVDSQADESMETFSTSAASSVGAAHRFGDVADVGYQRVAISSEDVGRVIFEDLRDASSSLITALNIRRKYIRRALMNFPNTLNCFLTGYYPEHMPRMTKVQAASGVTCNPHWRLLCNDGELCEYRLMHDKFRVMRLFAEWHVEHSYG